MSESWDTAMAALRVLGCYPRGLGGAVIRMRAGPDRDQLLQICKSLLPGLIRISPTVDDLHLFGGVDPAATLASGQVVKTKGLLATAQTICLVMAERTPPELAAKLCQFLDAHPDSVLLALDEGAESEEQVPAMLSERLAFHLEPDGHAPSGFLPYLEPDVPHEIEQNSEHLTALTIAASQFGIDTMRAPLMAGRTAAALAGLNGRTEVSDIDVSVAASLVFAHRATQMPADEVTEEPDDPPPAQDTPQDASDAGQDELNLSREMVVEAVMSKLPPEILAGLGRKQASRGSQGAGAGQKRLGNRRGRPLPSRLGQLDGRRRLDILATLRAAAPWQPIRRKATPDREGLLLRASDFRVKRFETKSDRIVIFAVDASGSAAISRLNEAKGAIELLLGQAYCARDHVALVSFRGEMAETLLAPTRSLVQTKRKLGALPGGGGTPLAAGLREAMQLSLQARSKGMSPVVVLLTDGKGNIALDGTPDRRVAQEDALHIAKQMRRLDLDVLVIDMATRPQTALRDLAQHLDSDYLPLPRADAHKLSNAVQSVMGTA
jgi:magnesium chelatase subunit D